MSNDGYIKFNDSNFEWGTVGAPASSVRSKASQINQSIPIEELARRMGVRMSPCSAGDFTQKCMCFHPGDSSPDMFISSKTNSWYSFCCSIGGTVVNFMQWALECRQLPHSPADAIERIEAVFSSKEMEAAFKNQIVPYHDTREVLNCLLKVNIYWRNFLEAMKNHPAYEEQKARCDKFFFYLDKKYPDPLSLDINTIAELPAQIKAALEERAQQYNMKVNLDPLSGLNPPQGE